MLNRLRSVPCLLGCILLGQFATSSVSGAVTWKNIQFGGSFSQGYLQSTRNNFPVDTKDGTFDFRETALNASTTFGTHLRVGAQVFAQTLGKYGDDKPVLDWAIVDYNFRPEFGIQVGRLKYPRGLYSDVLDLDMVRPFIFLPQSNYDSRLRDYQASFDGAKIYGSFSVGQNSFDYKLFYGDIPMKTDSGVADYFNTSSLFANPPGVQSIGIDSVRGAALNWNTPVAGLRFGLYYSSLSHLLVVGPFRQVPVLTSSIDLTKVEYEGVSAEYTSGPWTFAGEFLLTKLNTYLTLPAVLNMPATTSKGGSRSYYVSVARRLGSKVEVGTYYSVTSNSYPSATAPASDKDRRDWTLAARFDVNDHLLFKLEAHMINGTRDITNVPGISNPPGSLKDSMMLFAAKTTLSF
jgi:hypothetical protein